MVDIGVLNPVDRAEYLITPLVVVSKLNTSVRLCGDFKIIFNFQLNVQKYPIPTVAVLQTAVRNKCITKLDYSDANRQVELDDECKMQ